MNDDHRLLVRTVGSIAEDTLRGEGTSVAATVALWSALQDVGVTALGIDEGLGGSGGTLSDALGVVRQLGESTVGSPAVESAVVAPAAIAAAGLTVPQGILSFGRTTDLEQTRSPGGLMRVSGTARGVRWATVCNRIVIAAESKDGLSILSVHPTEAEIATVRQSIDGVPTADVILREVLVEDGVSFGTIGSEAWQSIEARGRLGTASMMIGAMKMCLHLAVSHARNREQFGRPLYSHQVVKHRLVSAMAEMSMSEALLDDVVHCAALTPEPWAVAAAKLRANIAASEVASAAHQIHGAIGLTEEYPLSTFTTRLWHGQRAFGHDAVLEAELGEEITVGDTLWTRMMSI